jgi:GntR family transcriptional repressor for pyruvate dehydrogenase complex
MKPIQKIATSQLIFERLRRAIHLGEYMTGDMLPPEREIAEKLDVSREKVREALRRLEKEGYVVIRRGPNGGHEVTQLTGPRSRHVQALKVNSEELQHLMEFRSVNECLAARLAAERRSELDLKRIATSIEEMRKATDIQKFRRADSAFHVAVAEASRNPYVLNAVVAARENIFLLHGGLDYAIVLETTLYNHARIFEAIQRGAGAVAAQEMEKHMEVAFEEICNVLLDV